jgi:hypothetical protein
MVLNLSSVQNTFSTSDRKRRTKIRQTIFMDEELGSKKSLKNSWLHWQLMHTAGPKSNFCSRRLETATYPGRILRTGRPPLPLGPSLPHFFKIVLLPVPEYFPSTVWRVYRRSRKFVKESWDWQTIAVLSSPFSVPRPRDCSYWSIHKVARNSTRVGRKLFRIATRDESRFQYSYPPSKMWARSPTDVIPRTR